MNYLMVDRYSGVDLFLYIMAARSFSDGLYFLAFIFWGLTVLLAIAGDSRGGAL